MKLKTPQLAANEAHFDVDVGEQRKTLDETIATKEAAFLKIEAGCRRQKTYEEFHSACERMVHQMLTFHALKNQQRERINA